MLTRVQVYMIRNTERKLRALAAWQGVSMSRVIALLIAEAYRDALIARTPPPDR